MEQDTQVGTSIMTRTLINIHEDILIGNMKTESTYRRRHLKIWAEEEMGLKRTLLRIEDVARDLVVPNQPQWMGSSWRS